jgi:hypothetical protein
VLAATRRFGKRNSSQNASFFEEASKILRVRRASASLGDGSPAG